MRRGRLNPNDLSVGDSLDFWRVEEQRALFHPRGFAGQLHWWSVFPFHGIVFGSPQRNIAKAAEHS